MMPMIPKHKDFKYGNLIEFYTFTKENNSNFLLLEAQDNSPYSIQIYQTTRDEYQPPKEESSNMTKEKALMISLICVGAVLIIVIIIFINILFKKRKLARKAYNEDKIMDYGGLMPVYPASYDTSIAKPINE